MRILLGWAIAGMAVAMTLFAFSVAPDAAAVGNSDYGLDHITSKAR